MLLNHAYGEPGWAQEGIYISFASDLSRPDTWQEPSKILDQSEFPGWYFFYPQVMGLAAGETDTLAGQTARLYVGGISRWEIDFSGEVSEPDSGAASVPFVAPLPVGEDDPSNEPQLDSGATTVPLVDPLPAGEDDPSNEPQP